MKASRFEFKLIVEIAERAEQMYDELGMEKPNRCTLLMDIEHAHAHIPMDLAAMLTMPRTDFAHDIGGIQRHIDRQTKKLGDCFVPRCALQ